MEWILLVQTRNVGLVTDIPTAEYLSARQVLGNLEIGRSLQFPGLHLRYEGRFAGKKKLMQRQKRQAAANFDQNLKF